MPPPLNIKYLKRVAFQFVATINRKKDLKDLKDFFFEKANLF